MENHPHHIPFIAFTSFEKDGKDFIFASENTELNDFIHYFKQVNCFIGANNSGKSRTLRAILKRGNKNPAFEVDMKQNIYTEIIPAINIEAEYLTAEDKEYIQAIQYFLDNHESSLKDINTAYHHFLILTQNAADFENKINEKSTIFTCFSLPYYPNRNKEIEKNRNALRYAKEKLGESEKKLDKDLLDKYLKEQEGNRGIQVSYAFESPLIRSYSNNYLEYLTAIAKNKTIVEGLENEIQRIEKEITEISIELIKDCSILRNEFQKWLASFNHTQKHVYIPILRGTRPLNDNKEDFYALRTQKDYKIDSSFTGLSLYEDLKKHLLGSHQERLLMRDFEKFLSEHFFEKQDVTLVPNINSDVVFIRIGDNERAIYELGDGIQALIILIFPLFMHREKGALIFIEEPELHLHPKWQRFFLNIIKTDFPQHQFFFTTHSNIFLSDNDVALYKVSQDGTTDKGNAKTAIQHIKTEHQEILSELGYKTSDLLHANYIIWIEGISDRIYLKKMIAILEPDLIEGIHYTFMFFGGCTNLLHHINFNEILDYDKINILNINPHCGFILDSDFKKAKQTMEPKRQALIEYCKKYQKHCWISDFREIENYIPVEIWKEAAENYAKNFTDKTIKDIEMDIEVDNTDKESHHFSDRFKTKVLFEVSDSVNINDKVDEVKNAIKVFNKNKKQAKGEFYTAIETLIKGINDVKKATFKSTDSININDKIKAAKEVVKIFPKNTAVLKQEKELYNAIEKLITDIKKANQNTPENDI